MNISLQEMMDEFYGHCVLITGEGYELIAAVDYGPRIVSIRRGESPNLFYNSYNEEYRRFYGHKMRLTIDKANNNVYFDDSPVQYSLLEDGVRLLQTVLQPVRLELSMDIIFGAEQNSLMIVHSVKNGTDEPIKLSIYTESPFISKGFVLAPQNIIPEDTRPDRILDLWGSKWTDKRLFIGDRFISLLSDGSDSKLKIGNNNTDGWCGFISGNTAFIKKYIHNRAALYPVPRCSSVLATHRDYLSIQTYSPFYMIEPEESARHVENWSFASTEAIGYNNETQLEGLLNIL